MTPDEYKELVKQHGTAIACIIRKAEDGFELTAKDLRKLRWLRQIQLDT